MSAAATEAQSETVIPDVRPIALWVVPVADLGGVARHVLDVFTTGMTKHRLVLFCPEGSLAARVRELGGAVVTAEFGPEAGFATSVRSLRRAIRSLQPAVVHSHLAYADFVATAAVAADPKVKLVSTEHGIAGDDSIYHGSDLKAKGRALAHATRLKRADALIAVSESTKREMQRKWNAPEAVQVILNGVDPAESRPRTNSDGLKILSLSRLAAEKRIDHLLRAFHKLLKSEPTATLTIAGTGPEESALKQLTDSLGVSQSVSFPGFVDSAEAMKEHDVLVQLSSWENCSYTLLDALREGMGVVATPVGGNPELVSENALVDAEDEDRIVELILGQHSNLSSRPQLESSWLTTAQMVSSTEELYERL